MTKLLSNSADPDQMQHSVSWLKWVKGEYSIEEACYYYSNLENKHLSEQICDGNLLRNKEDIVVWTFL